MNVTKRSSERIAQISLMTGKTRTEITEAVAGDIVAVVKMKNTLTGDTLCDAKSQVVIEPIKFPASLIDMIFSFGLNRKTDALYRHLL